MSKRKIIIIASSIAVFAGFFIGGYTLFAQNRELKNKVNSLPEPVEQAIPDDSAGDDVVEQALEPQTVTPEQPAKSTWVPSQKEAEPVGVPVTVEPEPAPVVTCDVEYQNSKIDLENSRYDLELFRENNDYSAALVAAEQDKNAQLSSLCNRGLCSSSAAEGVKSNYIEAVRRIEENHSYNIAYIEQQHNSNIVGINNTCY